MLTPKRSYQVSEDEQFLADNPDAFLDDYQPDTAAEPPASHKDKKIKLEDSSNSSPITNNNEDCDTEDSTPSEATKTLHDSFGRANIQFIHKRNIFEHEKMQFIREHHQNIEHAPWENLKKSHEQHLELLASEKVKATQEKRQLEEKLQQEEYRIEEEEYKTIAEEFKTGISHNNPSSYEIVRLEHTVLQSKYKDCKEVLAIIDLLEVLNDPSKTVPEEMLILTEYRPHFVTLDFYQILLLWRAQRYNNVKELCEAVLENVTNENEWAYRKSCPLVTYYHKITDENIEKLNLHAMITYFPLSEIYYYYAKAQEKLTEDNKESLSNCYHYRATQCFAGCLLEEANLWLTKAIAINENKKSIFLKPFVDLLLNGEKDEIIQAYDRAEGQDVLRNNIRFCFEYFLFLRNKGKTRPRVLSILQDNINSPEIKYENKLRIYHARILSFSKSELTSRKTIQKEIILFVNLFHLHYSENEDGSGLCSEVLVSSCAAFVNTLLNQQNYEECLEFLKFWIEIVIYNHLFYSQYGDPTAKTLSFGNWQYERFYLASLTCCLQVLTMLQVIFDAQKHQAIIQKAEKLILDFKQKVAKLNRDIDTFKMSNHNGDDGLTRGELTHYISISFNEESSSETNNNLASSSDDNEKDSNISLEQELLDRDRVQNVLRSLQNSDIPIGKLPFHSIDRRPTFETSLQHNQIMIEQIKFVEFNCYLVKSQHYAHSILDTSSADGAGVKNTFESIRTLSTNITILAEAHPSISRDNINCICSIHDAFAQYISKSVTSIRPNLTSTEIESLRQLLKNCHKLLEKLRQRYQEHAKDPLKKSQIDHQEILTKLDQIYELLNREEKLTQKPLTFLYGNNEKNQHLVGFPTEKIVEMMGSANSTYHFADQANISVHYITVVYSYQKTKDVIHIPIPKPIVMANSNSQVHTLDDLGATSVYAGTILSLINKGLTITKQPIAAGVVKHEAFDAFSHKHSEQAFFIWLLQKGPDFVIKSLASSKEMENKETQDVKILAISFDYGSTRSTCVHCALSALAIQDKDGDFAKKLISLLETHHYRLPSAGLYLTTRVLYGQERGEQHFKNHTPTQKNIKTFGNDKILHEAQPGGFGSGGNRNRK